MKYAFLAILAVTSFGVLAGCDSNPTNEPSKQSIDDANAARVKAVQDDPNMTQAQKDALIKGMGLGPDGQRQGR